MKRLLALLLCLLMALSLLPAAAAEDIVIIDPEAAAAPDSVYEKGQFDNHAEWIFDDGTLTLRTQVGYSTGNFSVPTKSSQPWAAYIDSVTSLVIQNNCGSISYLAFSGYPNLVSVSLPSTLQQIGASAFSGCTSLESVNIPGRVGTMFGSIFQGCTSLREVTLGSGLGSIGGGMFSGCTALTSIVIPDSVKTIGGAAFENSGIKNLTVPAGVTTLETGAFDRMLKLETVTFLGAPPTFGSADNSDVFTGVTATIYTPTGDEAWPMDVMLQYGGTLTWAAAEKPTITAQPKSVTAATDSTAKFTVKASGAASYQWYYRKSSSGSWAKTTLSGNKTATLSVKATAARNGYQYRCKVSNAAGYRYSSAATLTVMDKPSVTTQPKSLTAYVGTTAKFTVKASGAESYQWYYRTSSAGSWTKTSLTGNRTATLSVKATSGRNEYQYRCKITNAAGYVYTSAATLNVSLKPVVTTQPASKTASPGTTVKFTVKADGATAYQWYYRTSDSGSWTKCTGAGATTATLTVEAKSFRSGYQYRCKVINSEGFRYSTAATLTVK
ncbi:MAG: leucine-rich repeat protein [Oscillospiraceae bacterium]|nr:leucine-rich repeat protein [Oscillospiraceae bacterium]